MWVFAGAGGLAVVKLLNTAILARLLTPEDFGLMAAAMTVIGITQLFVQIGVGPALVYYKDLKQVEINTAGSFSFLLGLIACGLFYFLAKPVANFYNMPELENMIYAMLILFPLRALTNIYYCLLQKELHFKEITYGEILGFVVGMMLTGIVFALLGYGVWSLVYAQIGFSVVYFIVLLYYSKVKVRFNYTEGVIKKFLKYGISFSVAAVLDYTSRQIDYVVTGKYLGSVPLSYYNKAYQIMEVPNKVIGQGISSTLFSSFSIIENDDDKIHDFLIVLYFLIFALGIPIGVMGYFLADEIVYILLGDQWYDVVPIFKILCVGIVIRIAIKVGTNFLVGKGKPTLLAWTQLANIINILIACFIGFQFGLEGIAMGIVIAMILNFLILSHFTIVNSHLKWVDVIKIISIILLLNAFLAVIVFNVHQLIYPWLNPLFRAILIGIIGSAFILFTMQDKFLNIVFPSYSHVLQIYINRVKNKISSRTKAV